MNQPKDEAEPGFTAPDPSSFREGAPGDAGDEASEIRFSEEQALIEEQVNGIMPDTYNVPPGEPTMDSSDDGPHGGTT